MKMQGVQTYSVVRRRWQVRLKRKGRMEGKAASCIEPRDRFTRMLGSVIAHTGTLAIGSLSRKDVTQVPIELSHLTRASFGPGCHTLTRPQNSDFDPWPCPRGGDGAAKAKERESR